MMMEIVILERQDVEKIAPLVAAFRVSLKGRKGTDALPDVSAGEMEMQSYLNAGYPCFAAVEESMFVGYLVCRVDHPTVWVESLFVKEEYRRKGIATELLHMAERLALSFGEETVFHFVHPNNHEMIEFLRKNRYSVLNLIEIRKPYVGETLSQRILVGEHEFDY